MKWKRSNARGETLVETIVAFAVVMALLAMLATVLRGAARINHFASERMTILDEDCTRVEQNGGMVSEDGSGDDVLTLTPANSALLSETISIPLEVRSCEILRYFAIGGGG